MRNVIPLSILPAILLLASPSLFAQGTRPGPGEVRAPMGVPQSLENVGIDQKLNEQLPLHLEFRDESGRAVRLSDYFNKGKPVLLVLAYFRCPMLCSQILNDLTEAVRPMKLRVGKDFTILTISFDPRETPELARAKKKTYIDNLGRPGAASGWHFLTGDADAIARLTDSVGFRYRYIEDKDQFAHASGLILLTPGAKISRYFLGLQYQLTTITGASTDSVVRSRDLELSLVEASDGKIGSRADQILLYCLQYDGATGKYTLAVLNLVRIGGVVTVVFLIGFFVWSRRREPTADDSKTQTP